MFFFTKIKKKSLGGGYKKVVIIIGGAGYVGKALLKACEENREALFVVVSSKSVASGSNVISLRMDMTERPEEAVKRILALTGRIDVLVHAAAAYAFETAENLTIENLKREFEVNTFMPLLVTQEVCKQHWGLHPKEVNLKRAVRVVVLGSQAGLGKTERKELMVYSATKAALDVSWQYYEDFLTTKGVESIFLKPGALQKKEELNNFVANLKQAILLD